MANEDDKVPNPDDPGVFAVLILIRSFGTSVPDKFRRLSDIAGDALRGDPNALKKAGKLLRSDRDHGRKT